MRSFFLSLKTTTWTLLALILLFLVGAYMMPRYRDVFGPMNSLLLLQWAAEIGSRHPVLTWWFFGSIIALVTLTINTIVCSVQAVKGRWSRAEFLLRVSPQVIHIGFLLILFAHLIGAVQGYRISGVLPKGAIAGLPEGRALYLREIYTRVDNAGYLMDLSAEVYLFEDNNKVKVGVIGPNRPLFYRGAGVYLNGLGFKEGDSAIIMVTKDPGSTWALAGAIVFMIGSILLLAVKRQKAWLGRSASVALDEDVI